MTYKSEGDKYSIAVEQARVRVARAMQEHGRGGNVDAVNKANKELADAHARYRECQGGRVPDQR